VTLGLTPEGDEWLDCHAWILEGDAAVQAER
jgi:hypothetical protein